MELEMEVENIDSEEKDGNGFPLNSNSVSPFTTVETIDNTDDIMLLIQNASVQNVDRVINDNLDSLHTVGNRIVRKRKSYSVSEKLKIVNKIKKGCKQSSLARELGVPESTIRGWVLEENKLWKLVSELEVTVGMKRKRARRAKDCDLDNALFNWFMEMKGNSFSVSGAMIIAQAERLDKAMNGENSSFKASKGWLQRFQNRHGIRNAASRNKTSTKSKNSVAESFSRNVGACISVNNPVSADLLNRPFEYSEDSNILTNRSCRSDAEDDEIEPLNDSVRTEPSEPNAECDQVTSFTQLSAADSLPRNRCRLTQSSDITQHVSDRQNNHSIVSDGCVKRIQDLDSAKQEIFQFLSKMDLSQKDFEKLLQWMKTLRVSTGKAGKLYLSERRIIGYLNTLGNTKTDESKNSLDGCDVQAPTTTILNTDSSQLQTQSGLATFRKEPQHYFHQPQSVPELSNETLYISSTQTSKPNEKRKSTGNQFIGDNCRMYSEASSTVQAAGKTTCEPVSHLSKATNTDYNISTCMPCESNSARNQKQNYQVNAQTVIDRQRQISSDIDGSREFNVKTEMEMI